MMYLLKMEMFNGKLFNYQMLTNPMPETTPIGGWFFLITHLGGSTNEGTPIAGWFISWKIVLKWMIWGYPYFRKPPFLIKLIGDGLLLRLHAFTVLLAACHIWEFQKSWNTTMLPMWKCSSNYKWT